MPPYYMLIGSFGSKLEVFKGKTSCLADVVDSDEFFGCSMRKNEDTNWRRLANRRSGLRGDEHWQHWVRRLRKIVKLHGLPAAVRHDRNGNPDWRPSAFAVLIKAIQTYLPAYAARRAATEEAFSKAINQASLAGTDLASSGI